MNLKQSAARGVFWTIAGRWGRQGFNIIFLGILSRLLGAPDFGLIALATSFVEFTKILVDQGFGSAIIQFEDLEEEYLSTSFWVHVFFSAILFAGGVTFSEGIAHLFSTPELSPVIKVMSYQILAYGIFTTQESLLTRDMRFHVLTIRSLISVVLGGLVGVFMAVMGYGVWALVGRALAGSLVNIVVLWSASSWRPRFLFSFSHLKKLFSFSMSLVGNNLVEKVRENIDSVLIGFFLGTTLLGYYSIAYKLIDTLNKIIMGVFRTVSLPVFSRLQLERDKLTTAYFQAAKVTSVVFFPAYIGVLMLASPLTIIVFGSEWGSSVPVIRWLALLGAVGTLFMYNYPILISLGKTGIAFQTNILDTALSVVGMLIGAKYGIVEVAIGRTVASILVIPVPFVIIMRLLGQRMSTYLLQLRPAILATITMATSVLLIQRLIPYGNDLLVLISSVLTGVLTYLAYLYLLERNLLIDITNLFVLAIPGNLSERITLS